MLIKAIGGDCKTHKQRMHYLNLHAEGIAYIGSYNKQFGGAHIYPKWLMGKGCSKNYRFFRA